MLLGRNLFQNCITEYWAHNYFFIPKAKRTITSSS
nr:MAG TPA: hypothetical protein [Caudoviricetes sp.]